MASYVIIYLFVRSFVYIICVVLCVCVCIQLKRVNFVVLLWSPIKVSVTIQVAVEFRGSTLCVCINWVA